jgi:prepilin-type N-terminal cleavage/methylation domain-containing protein
MYKRSPFQRSKGFTLIELLVTLAVLAILVAVAVPSMSSILERRKVHGAGEKLFADLTYAKTEAIKQNTSVTVSFTGTGATWCYGIADDGATCDCTAADCTVNGVLKVTNQDDFPGVTVLAASSFGNTVLFTSFTPLRGTANAGNFQYTSPVGAELGVVVSNVGRVKMCSADFGFDACP